MRALVIAAKEMRSLLVSPLAYVFLMVFISIPAVRYFITGIPVAGSNRVETLYDILEADLAPYFASFPLAFALLIPALAMRLWPDELKSGTQDLLFAHPVSRFEVALGKQIAGVSMIVVGLLATLPVPLLLGSWELPGLGETALVQGYGRFDSGAVIGAYVGALVLGVAFLSVGLFMGALFREQVTAFIASALICLLLVLMGEPELNSSFPVWAQVWSRRLSFDARFEDLGRGVLVVRDLVYLISFAGLFSFLNVCVLEARRGR